MYKTLIRPLLFLIDPESVHNIAFRTIKLFSSLGLTKIYKTLFLKSDKSLGVSILGLNFKNPVGLAAGFDKDAKLIDAFSDFGFGFIEIGTITPKGQPGNDKPRLFRLPKDKALINRMGFNNKGLTRAVERLKKRKSNVIVGGNIGKNKATPNENAAEDYTQCFDQLHDYVDYFVVNISSPNTPGLRELQEKEPLKKLLNTLILKRTKIGSQKPILLKIAPDLTNSQLEDIIDILKETNLDGIIATNTTINRNGLKTTNEKIEKIGAGGLSGAPVTERSTEVIRFLRSGLGDEFPIIGVGGIMTPQDALDKLNAGANLLQIYTGFVYNGPGFINNINKAIIKEIKKN